MVEVNKRFDYWCEKLRIRPHWDIKLEIVNDPEWKKTGDFKIDPTDRKAVIMLNGINPKNENMDEIIVHELMHIKMYPLDQVCESLITSNFEEDSAGWNLAYREFFENLEITVEELAKCFLYEFGEDKEISFGRCKSLKSFNDLYEGLQVID